VALEHLGHAVEVGERPGEEAVDLVDHDYVHFACLDVRIAAREPLLSMTVQQVVTAVVGDGEPSPKPRSAMLHSGRMALNNGQQYKLPIQDTRIPAASDQRRDKWIGGSLFQLRIFHNARYSVN
jgi:hypothetical protein